MWLKYNHKFWPTTLSPGGKKHWEYEFTRETDKNSDVMQERIHELHDEFNWSEHYRGVEYDLVEFPPLDVLKDKIKSAKNAAKYYREHVKELEKLFEQAKLKGILE